MRQSQTGFTLVELLVTTVIIGIVTTGLYNLFNVHNRMAAKQEETTLMQQELLIIVSQMADEIRMCRYSPNLRLNKDAFSFSHSPNSGSPDYGRATNATNLYCTRDDDGDGNFNASSTDEHVGYALNVDNSGAPLATPDNILRKYASDTSTTKWQPAATNIGDLRFSYFDEDGAPSATMGDIRIVEINATAVPSTIRSGLDIANRTMTTRVWCRNPGGGN